MENKPRDLTIEEYLEAYPLDVCIPDALLKKCNWQTATRILMERAGKRRKLGLQLRWEGDTQPT